MPCLGQRRSPGLLVTYSDPRVLGGVLEVGGCEVGSTSSWRQVREDRDEEGFKEQMTLQLSLESTGFTSVGSSNSAYGALSARRWGRFWGHSDGTGQCLSPKELAASVGHHRDRSGASPAEHPALTKPQGTRADG